MLLFFLKPYQDETLCSLVYRTAKENLMDNPNWIILNFIKYSEENLYINEINWLTGEKLKKMAEFLSITNETAKLLTFRSTLEELGLNYNNISKNAWFLYSKTRCCSQCLKEQPYYRKKWSSSHSLICTKHKIFLSEECCNCKKQFDIRDIINDRCSKCKIHISNQNGVKVRNIQMERYQNIIDEILTEKDFSYNHQWIKNSKDFLITLEFISCWAARLINPQELSNKEFKFKYEGNILERNHLKNAKTIVQATCIYYYSFQIIDDWPRGFYRFLKWSEVENKPIYSYFLKNIISGLNGTKLWPLSKELTNYLTRFKMDLPKESEFINADEIKHYNKKFNASILHSSELHYQQLKYQSILFKFINRTEIEAFFRRFENSLTKEELREKWDTSAKSTFSILQGNIIDNVISFSYGSVSNWVIPLESINTFESYLNSISKSFNEPAITLNQAFKWIGPENSHVLFSGIMNKKIQFQWTDKKIGNCKVMKGNVYHYTKEHILNKSEKNGRISLKETTFILGIKKSDLNYWLNTQRFGPNLSNTHDYIDLEQYLYFAEKYITSLELTMILKLNMKQILKKKSLGQFPVISGPIIDDGKRILYDRKKMFKIL